ncbi:MAG: hypothetical protein CVU71_17290 [Deltaproteobacteria bacterium HGW-Deltaproteobacteria-6]|jgi:hypothetical protein|nr:MAG: hypothetical protein CVU71_17290 [Deltaproteobacteria bacterium HGW-Deltaproteobacteria-6]
MKSLHKAGISIVISIILLCAGISFAQENKDGKVGVSEWTKIIESKVTNQVGDKGLVNYEDGYIESVGTGAPPEQYYGKPQARPMALRAAQVDALRNLLETVQGVQIDSKTTVKDFAVESDVINTAISGMVKGAQIVKKEYLSDGTVEVTVRMPLSGVAKAVLPQAIADDKKQDMKEHKPVPFSKKSAPRDEVYTGLVIDGRGLQARPAMSPKVFDENGAEVYGTLIVKKDYAIQQGICGYARDLTAAQSNARVTSSPLTVKAIRVQGAGMSEFVISNEDAKNIRSAKDNLTFLQKCRVMVVLD